MKSFRLMWKSAYALPLLYFVGFAMHCPDVRGQGISPVSQDFNKKARGTVEVANSGDVAKIVSCRAQGFDVNEQGAIKVHPVDPGLHVRISTQGVVLQPKGLRQVSFEADPGTLPAWFLVTCRFMPVDQAPGLTLAMELSSIVIIQGSGVGANDVTLSAKHVGNKVVVEVNNSGAGLVRVASGAVVGHRKEAELRSFVLFPHQRRLLEADWKENTPPLTARIQVGKKHLEASVN